MHVVPEQFAWVFWDVDAHALRVEKDANYIIPRILEFATLTEVRWAVTTYGLARIHQFLRDTGNPELSERTLTFWRAVLREEKEPWATQPSWRKSNSAPWID